MSIGKFAKNLIQTTSLSNTEILAKVQEAFPTAKTSMACIAWYKSDLRKKGLIAKRHEVPAVKSVDAQINELHIKLNELRAKQVLEEVTE
jgi:hypothetical protein